MAQGRVRNWDLDRRVYFSVRRDSGPEAARDAQRALRQGFSAALKDGPDDSAADLRMLAWGDAVELPDGLSGETFTAVRHHGVAGFMRSEDLVEIAYVARPENEPDPDPKRLSAPLRLGGERDDADLLWGDMVQILERRGDVARARARGLVGEIDLDRLTEEALLETYFIDVGQGDGVLIRFPNGKHMLIDGGLPRARQQTGRNAADFVDWKFYVDYGDWRIDLDWMIASHSDADHYGGLHDLVDMDQAAREELDALEVRIGEFGHPGLSRFPTRFDGEGLGPKALVEQRTAFTRLLGDRDDAAVLTGGGDAAGLRMSGWWANFVAAVLANGADTRVTRLGLPAADAGHGRLPQLSGFGACRVSVLAPVTIGPADRPALPDLGDKNINTNGHSVCLRLDYGAARILMTGDLNTDSMAWLTDAYGQDLGAWRADVAKACHHGSHDVSFRFLEAINAAATVISSGDNEGHAHPRPEIVAACALSGRRELSADGHRVITPLVFMTEVERSVLLAEINRIEIDNAGEAGRAIALLGKPVAEFSGREFLGVDDFDALEDLTSDDRSDLVDAVTARERPRLEALEAAEHQLGTMGRLYGRRPTGVVGVTYPIRRLKRLRMMEKNVYGLVNVRTDGELVMCASKRDSGERWTIHCFRAGSGH